MNPDQNERRAGTFATLLAPARRRGFGPGARGRCPDGPGHLPAALGSGAQDTDRVVLLARAGRAAGARPVQTRQRA